MALPAIPQVVINFSSGASFGNAFILGTSKLGQAVLATGSSVIVDVSANVLSISTRRGRDLLQDKYLAGQATVRVNDPNSYFDPSNTSSPYYPNLQPLRKIQISATYGGTNYYLFSGYITEYRYTYPTSQETGFVDLICYDAFRLFFNSNVSSVSGATAGQDTGARVGKILDAVSFPSSMRSIQTGNTTCQADPGTIRTSLAAIQTAEITEFGAFYIDPAGNATFKNRTFVYNAQSATPIKFSNVPASPDITYNGIVFAFDDKTIINKMSATRIGGTTQTYSDATSIASFFTHSVTADNLLMQTDAVALSLATAMVNSRKDTTIRIDSITLDLTQPNYTAGVTAALDLDYFDTVEISNVQPAGQTITKKLQVQGIAHNITARNWNTTLSTQEALLDTNY